MQDIRLRLHRRGVGFVDDIAVVDDVDALRQCQCRGEVLLYQRESLAGRLPKMRRSFRHLGRRINPGRYA